MSDFLFKKDVDIYDPNVNGLVEFEAERQARRLIMIPSESIAPKAVRELLASPFANIYAEGCLNKLLSVPCNATALNEEAARHLGIEFLKYFSDRTKRFTPSSDPVV